MRLTVTVDGTLQPEHISDELDRIRDLIEEGFTSGEVASDQEDGRGWWELDPTADHTPTGVTETAPARH